MGDYWTWLAQTVIPPEWRAAREAADRSDSTQHDAETEMEAGG
jgi:hypothetical protein